MKHFILISIVASLLLSSSDCNENKSGGKKYKGRLEIAGICMNYTIKVIEGDIDSSFIEQNWTDEHSGKTYTKVFRPGNPCSFPASINQGDEFYFTILDKDETLCAVCEAYYPAPAKSLMIKVVDK